MPRILLVEDDDATRLLCARHLASRRELVVDEARNGEEALARLDEAQYDCVISDYRMGQVSGLDVLARALERQPDAMRFLMSGFADPAIMRGAQIRAKITGFIEKPIDIDAFLRELDKAVAHVGPSP